MSHKPSAQDLLQAALTYIEFPEKVDVDWLTASIKAELATNDYEAVSREHGVYAATNIDTAMGRFVAFVRLEDGMSHSDMIGDIAQVVQKELNTGMNFSRKGPVVFLSKLPDTAFETNHAKGWGYLQRGWMPQAVLNKAAALDASPSSLSSSLSD